MSRKLLIAAAAALLSLAAPAQEDRLFADAKIVPATAKPGDEVVLEVTLDIEPGWHIYGRDDPSGNPTTLKVTKGGGLRMVGAADIPVGLQHDTAGIVSFWVEGKAVIKQKFKVPDGTASGEIKVEARVDYMACTPDFCDPPAFASVTGKLTVDAPKAQGKPFGQGDPFDKDDPLGLGKGPLENPPLQFDTRVEPAVARRGEVVDVIVSVTVPDGWHVYGAKDENPIVLRAAEAKDLVARGRNRLPDGDEHKTGPLTNYWLGGGFELRQAFAVPEDAALGELNREFAVDYLQCDPDRCLDPATHSFSLPVIIEAGEPREEYLGADIGDDGPADLWKLIVAAIGAGLFALLMPCTYPMIPITISMFTKQAEARGGKVLPLSLVYGAGIVAIFVLIGVVVGPAIVPFATHWLTNAVIATAFIVFAFALFGWIEIKPPAFLMDAAGKAGNRGGYIGVLLMGATLVITSFTCTVPFVASLLAVASQGGTGDVVIGMATFGLTMAIPFVALSLLPGKMRGIPRAGQWMNTLKVFLGFVELAAALKFVSNVDVVVNNGPQWLQRELFLWLWVAIFVGAAIYLLRGFRAPGQQPGAGRIAGIAACLAFAGYCGYGATGKPLDNVMNAIAPPMLLGKHPIIKDDYQKALEIARADDRLVLINFTGFT